MIIDEHIESKLEERASKIREMLPRGELLAQLAEEASELSQAALKLRRVLDGTNPTPVKLNVAIDDLIEEFADTCLATQVCGLKKTDVQDVCLRKSARWLKRLREKEK